jgi:CelD/BcsL family acetyltransferase involved in cellulose biosynthesis
MFAVMERPRAEDELRFEPITSLDAAREEWDALARRSRNVFQTWEWTKLWWRHFGDGRPLLATLVRRRDGEPLAILPLYLATRRPLRIARFLGHGPGHELGPICAPGDRALACRALRRALREHDRRVDLFLGDGLPGDEAWTAELGGRQTARRISSPLIWTADTTWDRFLASRSHHFRARLRNHERRLARDWGLSYRLAEDPARLEDDMRLLFELHEKRWGPDPSEHYAVNRRFDWDLAPLALEQGWLRLWMMELEGKPAVALLGLRYGGVEWLIRFGRDPDPRRRTISAGLVLLGHAVRSAIEDGATAYRLGRSAAEYKDRFADADPEICEIAVPASLAGSAGVRGLPHGLRLLRSLRRRFPRRSERRSALGDGRPYPPTSAEASR